MSLPQSLVMYEDVQIVLDRALESEIGVSIALDERGHAVNFRQRCYKFRTLFRKEMAKMFPGDDPRGSTCAYDALKIVLDAKPAKVVEIRRRDAVRFNIRELKA